VSDGTGSDGSAPWPFGVHKAVPYEVTWHCAICGQVIKRVPGGAGTTYVHRDSGAVAAANPPSYSAPDAWVLMKGEDQLATGSEAEVKTVAQDLLKRMGRRREAVLRSSLYLTKPDGTHQGQKYDEAGFVPGEAIIWLDVDW
jgi:hypothetical protein